jgi:histidine triad (HIT) family protein
MAYDNDNIFAKILRGELPCHKIYEDDDTFAFLDIMPRADGHTLVIPKAPSVNIFDIEPASLATLIEAVRKLAPVVRDGMGADGVLVQQFNEAAAGQQVFHIHFHIVPRREGEPLRPHAGEMEDADILAANAEKIRAALADAKV